MKSLRYAVTSEPRGVFPGPSFHACEESTVSNRRPVSSRAEEHEHIGKASLRMSGEKPTTWAPRYQPGLVSSLAWSRQRHLQGISLPGEERFQFESPVIVQPPTPPSETCEPWRQQAPSCHVFEGPHGACHGMPPSGPSSHVLSSPLAPLHQHYLLLLDGGHAWLPALAVCRRPAAYSSVG